MSGKADDGPPPRPYASRDEAIEDALFAARMIEAMGDEVTVLAEGPGGLTKVTDMPQQQVWRRH